jgi:YggT family protein
MTIFGQVLATALWLYWLLFIFRLVFDFVQIFARSWRPAGPLLVAVEALYTVTDPPLRLIRRFIPPLRLGRHRFPARARGPADSEQCGPDAVAIVDGARLSLGLLPGAY